MSGNVIQYHENRTVKPKAGIFRITARIANKSIKQKNLKIIRKPLEEYVSGTAAILTIYKIFPTRNRQYNSFHDGLHGWNRRSVSFENDTLFYRTN